MAKTKVQMFAQISGGYYVAMPDGSSKFFDYPKAGQIVEVDEAIAASWLQNKYAVEVEDQGVEAAIMPTSDADLETATVNTTPKQAKADA
jgi:hypothetical protein